MLNIETVTLADIKDQLTQGGHAALLINDLKRIVNELVYIEQNKGTAIEYDVGTGDNQIPTNALLPIATSVKNGIISAANQGKLDSIELYAQRNQPTNLSTEIDNDDLVILSSTGVGTRINPATTEFSGLLTAYDKITINSLKTAAFLDIAVANGVASLDSAGKLLVNQIPDVLLGKVDYQGVWNAETNTPTLTTVPELKGHYYIVDVAGVFDGVDYEPKDIIISNGNSWDKIDNTDSVLSVNGYRGIINLTKSDIGLSDVDNTADVTKNVLSATKLTNSKTIQLTGKVIGTVTTDLSDTVTINTTVVEKGIAGGLATLDQNGKLTETELPFKVEDSVENNIDTWSSNKIKDYADTTAVTNAIVFAIALS